MGKGETVFKYGDFGDKFYVILRGEVAVKILDPKYKQVVPIHPTLLKNNGKSQENNRALMVPRTTKHVKLENDQTFITGSQI